MKKLFSILLALLCVLTVIFAFTSCSSSDADTFSVKKPSVQTGYTISGADTAVKGENYEFFPLLIKFIDAKQNLSIQVHPDDEYAMRVEGEYGKTEAWYILDCDPDAELILGFNREVSVEEFKEAAKSDAMMDICNRI